MMHVMYGRGKGMQVVLVIGWRWEVVDGWRWEVVDGLRWKVGDESVLCVWRVARKEDGGGWAEHAP